tara:strand:- start:35384 stop:35629 length:246 start_codon:yes stop_codon:yes gene_type:complete
MKTELTLDIRKVAEKAIYKKEDVQDLILYIDVLERRNIDQAKEIEKLLIQLVKMQSRLDFYRAATLPQKVKDLYEKPKEDQ